MMEQDQLLDILNKRFSTNQKGDYYHTEIGITTGVVVDTDDPLQQGRLRVFCPAYGDDPSKIFQLPWAVYLAPFGGTINNNQYERNGQTSNGSVSYGFWGIPEMGANVAVVCIDGDMRRRVYLGTIFDQQETHTLLNGRYKWGAGGTADGPLSSSGDPIEPAYSNAKSAFGGKNNAPEWQSREAEYSVAAVSKDVNQPPTPDKSSYLDQQYGEIADFQQFTFNKDIVGGHGYDWSGFQHIPFKSSRAFGFSSPGNHAIVMDDRISNNRMKFKTSSGNLFLMDDTNERIYVRTAKGNNWVEMDVSGNIDMHSERRVSIHAAKDINFSSDETIRMTATKGIYMYAGGQNLNPPLSAAPADGQIRIQAADDLHLVSKNLRQLSFEDTIFEIGGKHCVTVGDTMSTQVQNDMNLISNTGDFNTTVGGSYNLFANKNINEFSVLGSKYASKGNVEFYAYYGTVNIGAQTDITVKSVSGSINVQAVGGNSGGSGGVNIKSQDSQISVSKAGTSISTNGALGIQTGGGISMQAHSTSQQSQPFPEDQVPDVTCATAAPVPVAGYTGVDLAARVAYNAGFTGRSLVVAVAIAGAESSYNPNAIGDTTLQTIKWGPSCGFWQVRSLVDPAAYHYPDTLRVKDNLFNPTYNANAAYAFSNGGKNFGPWSTYMNKAYLTHVQEAIDAINRMCSPTPSPTPALFGENFDFEPSFSGIQSQPMVDLFTAGDLKPSVIVTDTSLILQTITDVYVNSSGSGQSIAILTGIKSKSDETVAKVNEIAAILAGCCSSTVAPLIPIIDAGVSAPTTQIPSNYFPYMNADSEQVFNLDNFDLNGGTIIT